MESKIVLDLNLFKIILDSEIRKLTGKTMKRFEISDDKELIKKEVREIQYEWARDFYDMLLNGKVIFEFNQSKGGKNGTD
jgi:hypothetical protein